jgi:hypothetical protein
MRQSWHHACPACCWAESVVCVVPKMCTYGRDAGAAFRDVTCVIVVIGMYVLWWLGSQQFMHPPPRLCD